MFALGGGLCVSSLPVFYLLFFRVGFIFPPPPSEARDDVLSGLFKFL